MITENTVPQSGPGLAIANAAIEIEKHLFDNGVVSRNEIKENPRPWILRKPDRLGTRRCPRGVRARDRQIHHAPRAPGSRERTRARGPRQHGQAHRRCGAQNPRPLPPSRRAAALRDTNRDRVGAGRRGRPRTPGRRPRPERRNRHPDRDGADRLPQRGAKSQRSRHNSSVEPQAPPRGRRSDRGRRPRERGQHRPHRTRPRRGTAEPAIQRPPRRPQAAPERRPATSRGRETRARTERSHRRPCRRGNEAPREDVGISDQRKAASALDHPSGRITAAEPRRSNIRSALRARKR